ncbi:MAG: hypothetical protein ACLU4Q_06825 [Streptococcus thermophilus]
MAITIREAIAISKIRLKYLKNFGSSILFLITTINKSKKNIIAADIAIKNADGSLTYFNGSETKS